LTSINLPAHRDLSSTQRAALWVGPTFYGYDQNLNGVGQLSRVEQRLEVSVDPTAGGPPSTGGALLYSATYAYEANGRVASETREFNPAGGATPALTQTVTRTYNALGGVTTSKWDDGQRWTTSYDARGLPQSVDYYAGDTAPAQRVADYGTRSLSGQVRTRSTGFGGIWREWQYDELGRPTADIVRTSSTTYAARIWTFSGAGDVQAVWGWTRSPSGQQVSANASYTYDKRHRILSARGPWGSSGQQYQADLTYSPTGNIATARIAGLPQQGTANQNRDVEYQYSAVEPQAVTKLVLKGTTTPWAQFAYDASGNMTSREWPLGQAQTMTWDGDDQLRKVVSATGATESYHYDHTSNRVWARETSSNGSTLATRYWFGEVETDVAANGSAVRYLHLADGGGTLARAERSGTSLATLGVPSVELQFSDGLQNLMLAMKASGTSVTVTAYFHYGAFGEVVAQAGEATHRKQFNGKENDAVSGLRYYGYRYYDPLTLRWNSRDPLLGGVPELGIANPQNHNLYAFSLNNPLRYLDPDGLEAGSAKDGHIEYRQESSMTFASKPYSEADAPSFVEEYRTDDEGRKFRLDYVYLNSQDYWDADGMTVRTWRRYDLINKQDVTSLKDTLLNEINGTLAVVSTGLSFVGLDFIADFAMAVTNTIGGRWGDAALAAGAILLPMAGAGTLKLAEKATAKAGLKDLARFRQELGLVEGEGTLARLDVGGHSFYGVNAHGRPVTLKVNAITKTHAEADVFQQAAEAAVSGGKGTLFVDRALCPACGRNGGVRGMMRQLGLDELKVVTPQGTQVILP